MDLEKLKIKSCKKEEYRKLLKDCYYYAKKSNHPSTHNAAFLVNNSKVVLKGLNILPPKVEEKRERFYEGNKHIYLNHAERDVIYKAAKKGICTKGLTMVMPWLPCIPCANAIISAGIKRLIVHKQMIERTKERWRKELKDAVQIMMEADVHIIAYDGVIGAKAYMHRKEWDA